MAERFHLTEEELLETTASITASLKNDDSKNPDELKLPIVERFLLNNNSDNDNEKSMSPTVILVVGMAGSGKTTFMSQLYKSLDIWEDGDEEEEDDNSDENGKSERNNDQNNKEEDEDKDETEDKKKVGYFINLDPATKMVPYGASIDIRDTVDYKEVMKQHNLGPNGAIMTSLNLFATKFDQVISILENRCFDNTTATTTKETSTKSPIDTILVDTPGQIEAFTWSASGTIITEGLATSFPTVLAYIIDTPRCAASPHTFMSNMLYACSMLYRTKLPLIIIFNKIDVVPCSFAIDWMTNFDSFQEALDDLSSSSTSNTQNNGYYTSLTRSLSLVLDEFYNQLNYVGVSSITGEGIDEFLNVIVPKATKEFITDYVPDLRYRVHEQYVKKQAMMRINLKKFQKDAENDKTRKQHLDKDDDE